ncbi:glycosyltransferase [Candidatus Beckwithbacteria bacterium]|nr:glycosyltransferase [Candidatus Beckwithbacteria bacterium]
MNLAPIILFVYNRPQHALKTLEMLQKNDLASQSELFIFADGAKNQNDDQKIREVRKIIRKAKDFKKIKITEQNQNLGLKNSIIKGVAEIIKKSKKVIVLEDDILTSPYFLNYMNQALEFYENDKKIAMIGAWSPKNKNLNQDIYLTQRACSWGWATWIDRFIQIDWEIKNITKFFKNQKLQKQFNQRGYNLTDILKKQSEGKIDTWDIYWDFWQFKRQAFCLRPKHSLVKNIGTDGTGTHYKNKTEYQIIFDKNFKPKLTQLNFNPKFDQLFQNSLDKRNYLYYLVKIKNKIYEYFTNQH